MKESKVVLLAASKKVVRQPKLAILLPSVNAAYLPGADEALPLPMTGLSLSPVLFLSPLVQQCTLVASYLLASCFWVHAPFFLLLELTGEGKSTLPKLPIQDAPPQGK